MSKNQYFWNNIDGFKATIPGSKPGSVEDITDRVLAIDTSRRAQTLTVLADKDMKRMGREKRGDVGKYVWAIYQLMAYPFVNSSVSASNVTRLMYLSTFTNYFGELVFDNGKPITKDHLQKVLNIAATACDAFYREVVGAGYISKTEDDRLIINQDVFRKGKISNKKIAALSNDGQFLTRVYIEGVRSLYAKVSTPRQHKTLSYIFQILPFVNREHNVVCFNPLETNVSEIQRMTLGDFCDIIGQDRSNASRVAKTLFQTKFQVGGKEQYAIRYVIDSTFDKAGYSIFINPNVYYAGSSWSSVNILKAFTG